MCGIRSHICCNTSINVSRWFSAVSNHFTSSVAALRGGETLQHSSCGNLTYSAQHLLYSTGFLSSGYFYFEMEDDYGKLDNTGRIYTSPAFSLESGDVLENAEVCYNTYGVLNSTRSNCVVVCHGFTGNSSVDQWWGQLLGPGLALDTDKYFIVCANVLGSCYGSSGPSSVNPRTGEVYGITFPQVTIRDSVKLHLELVKQHIGIESVHAVVGGSMGGMQALEWIMLGQELDHSIANTTTSTSANTVTTTTATTNATTTNATTTHTLPYIRSAVVIGCGARHTAWQIAFSELQRQAIFNDPLWQGGSFDTSNGPVAGLSLARQIGMVSYRSAVSYDAKFGRRVDDASGQWQVQRYLQHQGTKLTKRMDALTYVRLTQSMDTHDVSRGRLPTSISASAAHNVAAGANDHTSSSGSVSPVQQVLSAVCSKVTIVGMDTDVLYPLHEQQQLASYIPNAVMHTIHTTNGHDGFLLEHDQMSAILVQHLNSV